MFWLDCMMYGLVVNLAIWWPVLIIALAIWIIKR